MLHVLDPNRLRLRAYLALNRRLGQPFIYEVNGRRGFFSEINNLMNGFVYGLLQRRRIIVDCKQIGEWSDFFTSTLPTASEDVRRIVPKEWVINGITPQFKAIRDAVAASHRGQERLVIRQLWLSGDLRSVKRSMSKVLLSRSLRKGGLPPEPYAVFHVRRGDKIVHSRSGRNPEGENTPLATYMRLLEDKARSIRSIFVMTDDYTAIEELRRIAPDFSITSFCQPEERGYDQRTFMKQPRARKTESIRRLLDETDVAAKSQLFLGGFKSNVARFVCLMHDRPDRCFSVDGTKDWMPW